MKLIRNFTANLIFPSVIYFQIKVRLFIREVRGVGSNQCVAPLTFRLSRRDMCGVVDT